MADKPIPTPEELRQLLTYDPETGKLFWKERPASMFGAGNQTPERNCSSWNKKYAGKPAFTALTHGYHVGAVKDTKLYAHRVAWAIQTGSWPSAEIDHVNGDRGDNRWGNLRDATHAENHQNLGVRRDNTSGWTGVYKCKRSGKWAAKITRNRTHFNLGKFPERDAAIAAYAAAKRRLHTFSPEPRRPK